jgi:hypothetical protein
MGTIFEPSFGAFPGMDSYVGGNFLPFGPPVDFAAECARPEQWQSKRRRLNDECSQSSDTPGMYIEFYTNTT